MSLPPPPSLPQGAELKALIERYRGNVAEVARHLGVTHRVATRLLMRNDLYGLARDLHRAHAEMHSPSMRFRRLAAQQPKEARAQMQALIGRHNGELRAMAAELGVSGSGMSLLVRLVGLEAVAARLRSLHGIMGNRKWLPDRGVDAVRVGNAMAAAKGDRRKAAAALNLSLSGLRQQLRLIALRSSWAGKGRGQRQRELREVLERHGWNVKKAASELAINTPALRTRMRLAGVKLPVTRAPRGSVLVIKSEGRRLPAPVRVVVPKAELVGLIERYRGSATAIGRHLGLDRNSIERLLERHGIAGKARERAKVLQPIRQFRELVRADPKEARRQMLARLERHKGELKQVAAEWGMSAGSVSNLMRLVQLEAEAARLRARHFIPGNRKWIADAGIDRQALERALVEASGSKREAARRLGMSAELFESQCRRVGIVTNPARWRDPAVKDKSHIVRALLRQVRGDVKAAAEVLAITPESVKRRAKQLGVEIPTGPTSYRALPPSERRRRLVLALERNQWLIHPTARELGVGRTRLLAWMSECGIERREPDGGLPMARGAQQRKNRRRRGKKIEVRPGDRLSK